MNNLVHVVTVNLNAPALNAVSNTVSNVFTSRDFAFEHAKKIAFDWVAIFSGRDSVANFEAREIEQKDELHGFWIYRNGQIIGRVISNSRELKS